jgi:hypothetical protein
VVYFSVEAGSILGVSSNKHVTCISKFGFFFSIINLIACEFWRADEVNVCKLNAKPEVFCAFVAAMGAPVCRLIVNILAVGSAIFSEILAAIQ